MRRVAWREDDGSLAPPELVQEVIKDVKVQTVLHRVPPHPKVGHGELGAREGGGQADLPQEAWELQQIELFTQREKQ